MNTIKKILTVAFMLCLTASLALNTHAAGADTVLLGGMPFGLKLYTQGVLVINVDDGSSADTAGIKENDIILSANDTDVTDNDQLREIITSSNGADIELSLMRDNTPITVTLAPETNDEDEYEAGMWIRDSTAGLGTITYFDEETRSFGALGHGICDRDTGMLMPLKSGEVLKAEISSVCKAQRGVAGGLNGYMDEEVIGIVSLNNSYGIYGRYSVSLSDTRIECADDSEIRPGAAQIVTTTDENGPKTYDIEIESVNTDNNSGQNMVIRVTDEDLKEKTGGIIQGMSGSPILQNGKLIGAVTHVFVNTPEKGYGITISNMRENYAQYGGIDA